MTESNNPKYNLGTIKMAFNSIDKLNMTATAMSDQYLLGFSDQDVVNAIQDLTHDDFYKSMPPVQEGFTSWQDVYKSNFQGIKLYIKFQINNKKELILSFKKAGK